MTWEADLLAGIGAPASDDNVLVCDLWAASEGTLAHNNPFAVSGHFRGATTCLAQCGTANEVMAYDTLEHGVEATWAFLGGSYYSGIVGAFRADAGPAALYAAINTSPWCSGCQGGHYPIALWNYLQTLPPIPLEVDMQSVVYAPSPGHPEWPGTYAYIGADGHLIQCWWDGAASPPNWKHTDVTEVSGAPEASTA